MADDRVSLSAAIDIGAIGFELPQVKGWKQAYEYIREETGGTLAVYELILNAGRAFSEATRLERVDWEDKIWDDELIGFVEKIVKRINKGRKHWDPRSAGIDKAFVILPDELLKMAREHLGGAGGGAGGDAPEAEELPRKVKSLKDLKEILTSGDPEGSPHEFFVALGVGRSSKQMHYNDPEPGWYWVYNEIDGTEQELKGDKELASKTNIVEAIKKGAFWYEGQQS